MPVLALVCGDEVIASYRLDAPVVVVGREDGCDIKLTGPMVSRKHCKFVASGDTYSVEDLGSHNGTYFNGVRVERQTLVEGDRISIVPHTLVYHTSDMEPLAAPAPSGGKASTDFEATMEVDAAEVNRQLARLRGEAEPHASTVSHEALSGDADLVKVSGQLDGPTSDRLGRTLKVLLAQGRCRVVIDLTEAGNLTREGVAMLLAVVHVAKAKGGKLVLLNPATGAQEISNQALAEVFTIARDRQEALSLLGPTSS